MWCTLGQVDGLTDQQGVPSLATSPGWACYISHLQAVTVGGRWGTNRRPVSHHLTCQLTNQGRPVSLAVGGDRRESGGNYYNSNFYNGDNQNITEQRETSLNVPVMSGGKIQDW